MHRSDKPPPSAASKGIDGCGTSVSIGDKNTESQVCQIIQQRPPTYATNEKFPVFASDLCYKHFTLEHMRVEPPPFGTQYSVVILDRTQYAK